MAARCGFFLPSVFYVFESLGVLVRLGVDVGVDELRVSYW
jgi:hypothetical protein